MKTRGQKYESPPRLESVPFANDSDLNSDSDEEDLGFEICKEPAKEGDATEKIITDVSSKAKDKGQAKKKVGLYQYNHKTEQLSIFKISVEFFMPNRDAIQRKIPLVQTFFFAKSSMDSPCNVNGINRQLMAFFGSGILSSASAFIITNYIYPTLGGDYATLIFGLIFVPCFAFLSNVVLCDGDNDSACRTSFCWKPDIRVILVPEGTDPNGIISALDGAIVSPQRCDLQNANLQEKTLQTSSPLDNPIMKSDNRVVVDNVYEEIREPVLNRGPNANECDQLTLMPQADIARLFPDEVVSSFLNCVVQRWQEKMVDIKDWISQRNCCK